MSERTGGERRFPYVTEPGGRLAYVPALDGLRAVAVIAVLVYHHDPQRLPGGFLGVSLFFTLSGFLITSLLLTEDEVTGRVQLRRFWGRRIRRLLPASVLALGLACVVTVLAVPGAQQGDVLADIRAAVLHIANWHFIAAEIPYADLELTASPVRHYWSLAIEEQFYLLFPVLVAVTRPRRSLFAASLVLVVALSLVQQLRIDDFGRVYEGSDTRAGELAVGALLALAHPHIRTALSRRGHPATDVLGLTGLAAFAVVALRVPLTDPAFAAGGLLAVTSLWVLLLVGAMDGRRTGQLLATRPLVELGRRSYGIYLFHFPLFVLLSEERLGYGGTALFAVRVAATLLVAFASYQLVESPIRYGFRPLPRLAPGVAVGAVAALIVTTLVLQPPPRPEFEVVAQEPAAAVPTDTTDTTETTESTDTTETPPPSSAEVPEPPTPAAAPDGVAPEPETAAAAAAPTTAPPVRAPRVLVVGDSTSRFMGQGLQRWGAQTGLLDTTLLNGSGCVVLQGLTARHRDGLVVDPPCGDVMAASVAELAGNRFDAVVVLIGSFQLADWTYPDLEGFHSIAEPEIQRRYVSALSDDLDDLAALDIPVLWADLPRPEFDIDLFSETVFGAPWPGSGPATMNDPVRHAALVALDEATIARYPRAELWGFTAAIAGPDGVVGPDVRPDGLHMEPEAAERLGPALDEAMADAYRAILARTGSDAAPNRWTR